MPSKPDTAKERSEGRVTGDVFYDSSGRFNFQKVPCCMYFYYVYGEIGNPDVRHYYHTIDDIPIDNRIEAESRAVRLINNARGNNNNPEPNGKDWIGITWKRKSIIAIFIDIEGVKLSRPGLRFTTAYDGNENHGFCDGWQTELKGGSIIFFTNHMKKNRQGSDVEEGEKYYYHFDLLTTPQLGWRYRMDPSYPDSGGTNLGPPVPPPY